MSQPASRSVIRFRSDTPPPPPSTRPLPSPFLLCDPTRLTELGWRPDYSFQLHSLIEKKGWKTLSHTDSRKMAWMKIHAYPKGLLHGLMIPLDQAKRKKWIYYHLGKLREARNRQLGRKVASTALPEPTPHSRSFFRPYASLYLWHALYFLPLTGADFLYSFILTVSLAVGCRLFPGGRTRLMDPVLPALLHLSITVAGKAATTSPPPLSPPNQQLSIPPPPPPPHNEDVLFLPSTLMVWYRGGPRPLASSLSVQQ